MATQTLGRASMADTLREALESARDGFINLRPEWDENPGMRRQMDAHIIRIDNVLSSPLHHQENLMSNRNRWYYDGEVAQPLGESAATTQPPLEDYARLKAENERLEAALQRCYRVERVFKVSKVYGSEVSASTKQWRDQSYVLGYFTTIERARAYVNMRKSVPGAMMEETCNIEEVSIKELS